jgi:EAL domain-containing protein (putative c-di-GMP-specific phosphodiesterase class I)/GGDEF domain-containing protein
VFSTLSLVRLIWLLVTVAYAATAVLTATLLLPRVAGGIGMGLQLHSQARVQAVALALAQASPVDDELGTLLPQLQTLASTERWASFVLLTPGDAPRGQRPAAAAGWERFITGSWARAGGQATLRRGDVVLGKLQITVNTDAATEQVRTSLLLWLGSFALLGALLLGALWRLERWARQPLDGFYAQIEGLSERRFVSVQEPRVAEWAVLSRSLNVLVARVQQMLQDRDEAVKNLMDRLEHDELTGAASRDFFMASLKNNLRDNDAGGGVAIVRVHDLEGMNRRAGRNRTDEFLVAIATALRTRMVTASARANGEMDDTSNGFVLARLNGADFGLLLPGATLADWRERLDALGHALQQLVTDGLSDQPYVAWVGGTTFLRGEAFSDVLVRVDSMVMASESERLPACVTEPSAKQHAVTVAQWRVAIETAIDTGHLSLQFFAVHGSHGHNGGNVLHREGMLRLIQPNGDVLDASSFIPPAVRCGRISDLDLKAVQLALLELQRSPGDVAVNMAPQSITRPIFQRQLAELLRANAPLVKRLWIELRDPGTTADTSLAVRALCDTVVPLGCRVGIDHFGLNLSLLPLLNQAKVHYVKLAPALVDGATQAPRMAAFVAQVAQLGARVGVTVIANGVRSSASLPALARMGVVGFTGPGLAGDGSVAAPGLHVVETLDEVVLQD